MVSDAGAEGPKLFVVVARDKPELYEHVRRQFAGDGAVEVILDRRGGGPPRLDERQGERRRPRPGQEVPADVPLAIRPRASAPPSPAPEAPRGQPGEGHDEQLGRPRQEDAAAFQAALRVIDSALALARPLSALLRRRHVRPNDLSPLNAHPEADQRG